MLTGACRGGGDENVIGVASVASFVHMHEFGDGCVNGNHDSVGEERR